MLPKETKTNHQAEFITTSCGYKSYYQLLVG